MKFTQQFFAIIFACACMFSWQVRADYYPIKLVNNTANTNSAISPYIIFMAQDTTKAANYCVLKLAYDAGSKMQKASLVPIVQSTDSRKYIYRIDSLQGYNPATKSVNILIPNTISGRCMISLNYPLYMPAIPSDTGSPQWVFQDPSVSNTADVSYDIIYDKFEFTYNQKNVFYIDPTAVDFFAIPIGLKAKAGSSGASSNAHRGKLMKTITKVLNDSIDNKWNVLVIKDSGTILRVTAPNLAPAFDAGYLSQNSYNYIDSLIKYYQTHIVQINCSELDVKGDEIFDTYGVTPAQDPGAYIFTSSPITNGLWIFSNKPALSKVILTDTIDMNTAVSNNFFGPGTAPFITPNKTVISIIVKNITAAFTVGLLPAPDSMMLDSAYLNNPSAYPYYKRNKQLKAPKNTGPWYNLYTKALHAAIPQIYAFAYDDVLGQSGTLVSSDKTDTITVTLGDMGNITIPKHSSSLPVYADTVTYSSGFVHIGNQYIDTIRWKVPFNQPPNARYFFMGSGPDFTIADSTFLSYQYGNFYKAADTMGWVSIPDTLLTGNCVNTIIPMSVFTCGGPYNPCPTAGNWKIWTKSASYNSVPAVDNVVYTTTISSMTAWEENNNNTYTTTVEWTVPANQPANARYFLLAGGPGYIAPADSMIIPQLDSLKSWNTTTATVTIPASLINANKLDSLSMQVFTCGGPGHPCPTSQNVSLWQCGEGSVPVYPPSSPAALKHKRKSR